MTAETDKRNISPVVFPILILMACAVWIFSFRDFFSGRVAFSSDALSYYEHIKFFIESLARGVYPMWDPHWNYGVPNEFFLRRFGSFNPFWLTILAGMKCGLSYFHAYRFFLGGYFLLGMCGFYLLAEQVLGDKRAAYISFLVILFSSLGTRLYDSYIYLTLIPMVWFFYFLLSFSRIPRRSSFVGVIFTVMTLMTTYVPFYFLSIFLSFLGFSALLNWRRFPGLFREYGRFIRKNKRLVVGGALVLLLVCLPGLLLFQDAGSGEIVLPKRHYKIETENQFEVNLLTSGNWAILEEIAFSMFYTENLRRMRFAVFYLPLFFYVLILLGIWARVNKKMLLLTLLGACFLIMSAPRATPVYQFLYENVFFFRLFRNLHFFLWMAILPVVALVAGEQVRQMLTFRPASRIPRVLAGIWVLVVHAAVAGYLYHRGEAIDSSYAVLLLSVLICLVGLVWPRFLKGTFFLVLALAAVTAQSLEVMTHLSKNSPREHPFSLYDDLSLDFSYTRGEPVDVSGVTFDREAQEGLSLQPHEVVSPTIYYSTKSYNNLQEAVEYRALGHALYHRIAVYDKVQDVPFSKVPSAALEQIFSHRDTRALVNDGGTLPEELRTGVGQSVLLFEEDSEQLTVLSSSANHLKLRTHFPQQKFLVFNDTYHSRWQALVNGQRVPLYRANYAFKGLVLPAGENTVVLKYNSGWRYALEYSLWVFSGIFLLGLIWFRFHEYKEENNEKNNTALV